MDSAVAGDATAQYELALNYKEQAVADVKWKLISLKELAQ